MLSMIWDLRGYFFWLLVISLCCWGLERVRPWRREQRALREQVGQDLFWLVFNGHYAGVLMAVAAGWIQGEMIRLAGSDPWSLLEGVRLLAEWPLWGQFLFFLTAKDFCEWCVHNLLHRVSWLWSFHKLHHSIAELDWIGNMRFHWMEIVVYRSLTYLPLVVLGVDGAVILWMAAFSTLIGHLNHANLRISWGPLRYLFNSARMHVWHHDVAMHGKGGQNFAIIFSTWDWLFGTVYWPEEEEQPGELGFEGMEAFPKGLIGRLLYPFWRRWT